MKPMNQRTRIIMLRAAALENGDKTYFTGLPCSKGHVSPRRTLDSLCLECYTLKGKQRQQDTNKIQRKNSLTKLHYWAEQIKNLSQKDRDLLGLATVDAPKQVKATSAASVAILKIMLATEIMQRARNTGLDVGRIADQIIRLFDEDDDWWHKMSTRPVNDALIAVMQRVETEEVEYFIRGGEYAAEHNIQPTRGVVGRVY